MNYIQEGSFGKKRIYYDFFPVVNPGENYYVFFHGVYSTCFKPKTLSLAKSIVDQSLGSVFLFETSRQYYSFERESQSLSFEEYITESFYGKTFQNELDDVKTIIRFFKEHLITTTAYKLHFIGFSLGGTMLSFLISENRQLSSITLFGSGITTKGQATPIRNEYPKKEVILSNFNHFPGNMTLIQGTEDSVVPIEEAREIIFQANQAKTRKLILWRGVDHLFTKIDGSKNEKELHTKMFHTIKETSLDI